MKMRGPRAFGAGSKIEKGRVIVKWLESLKPTGDEYHWFVQSVKDEKVFSVGYSGLYPGGMYE